MAYRRVSEIRKLSRNTNNINKLSKWGTEISFFFDLFLDIAPVPDYEGKVIAIQDFMIKHKEEREAKRKLSQVRKSKSRRIAPISPDIEKSNASLSSNKDSQHTRTSTKKEDDPSSFDWTMFVDPVTLRFLPESMEERYFRIMLLKNRVLMVRILGIIGVTVSLLNVEVLSRPSFVNIWIVFLITAFFLSLLAWIQTGTWYIELAIKSQMHRLGLRLIEYLIVVGAALMEFHPENQIPFAGSVTICSYIYAFLISGLSGTYIESYCLLATISIIPCIKFILYIIDFSFWHAIVYITPIVGVGFTFLGFIAQGDRMRRVSFLKTQLVEQQLQETTMEKSKTDYLLSVCLPRSIITRLKGKLTFDLIAQRFDETTVMFGDLKNFKQLAKSLDSMKEAVGILNGVFSHIDETLPEFVTLEKIKTVSSKILLVGGLDGSTGHLPEMVDLALMLLEHFKQPQSYTPEKNGGKEEKIQLDMAFGIAVGPMVAGIVGKKKFVYDVYGDVVNTASRMLSVSSKGQIIVSEDLWGRLSHSFDGEFLGYRNIKGKGRIGIIHVIKRKTSGAQLSVDDRPYMAPFQPNRGIPTSLSRPGINLHSLVSPSQVTAIHTSSSIDSYGPRKSGDRRASVFSSSKKSSIQVDSFHHVDGHVVSTVTASGSFSISNSNGHASSSHDSSQGGQSTHTQVTSVVNIELPSTLGMNNNSRKQSLQRRFSFQTEGADEHSSFYERLGISKSPTFPVSVPIIESTFDDEQFEMNNVNKSSLRTSRGKGMEEKIEKVVHVRISLPEENTGANDDDENYISPEEERQLMNEPDTEVLQTIPTLPDSEVMQSVHVIPATIEDQQCDQEMNNVEHEFPLVDVPVIDIDDFPPTDEQKAQPHCISTGIPKSVSLLPIHSPLPPLPHSPSSLQNHINAAFETGKIMVAADAPISDFSNISRQPSTSMPQAKSKDMALEIVIRMLSKLEEDDDPETGARKYMKVIYDEVDPYSLAFDHKVIEEEFRRDLVMATEARSGWRMIRTMSVIVMLLLTSFLFLSISSSTTPATSFTSSFRKVTLSYETSWMIAVVHGVILVGLSIIAWLSLTEDESTIPSFRRRVFQGIIMTIFLIAHGVAIGFNWSNLGTIPLYMNMTIVPLLDIMVIRAEGLLIHHKAVLSFVLLITLEGIGHYIGWSAWSSTISVGVINCLWLVAFHRIERSTRIEYLIDLIMDTQAEIVLAEAQKSNMLINSILPEVVIKSLVSSPDSVVFESLKQISVLSMDIVGFTAMSSNKEPLTIVHMLNTAFTYFDYMSEAYNVEKITTIGDAYMACSAFTNAVDPRVGAAQICLAALHMQNYVQKTLNMLPFVQQNFDMPVSIRIGIHSGLCYGAIMGGPRNFRYDVMGDTVEMADKVQEKCPPGSVLISESTRQLLEGNTQFHFSKFHDPEMQGPMWIVHFADENIEDVQGKNVDMSGPLKAAANAVHSMKLRRLSMNVKPGSSKARAMGHIATRNQKNFGSEPFAVGLIPPTLETDFDLDLDGDDSHLLPDDDADGNATKRRATINLT